SLESPKPGASKTHLAHDGRVHPLPEGLSFGLPRNLTVLARTPLLSWGGKLRAGLDLVLPERSAQSSLGELIRHRLGSEVQERLFEPMVHALYGTPSDELDHRTVIPWLKTGSVIRQLMDRPQTPAERMFLRTPRGLGQIVETLHGALEERISLRTDTSVERARPMANGRWEVTLKGGETLTTRHFISALPPHIVRKVIDDEKLADTLADVRMRSADSVLMAVSAKGTDLPHGSGLLAHPDEHLSFLAASFVSQKWEQTQTPEEYYLRVVLIPNAGESREQTIARAYDELAQYIPLGELRWAKLQRYKKAMLVPTVGHVERVKAARSRAEELGLTIIGAAFDGPGVAGALAGAARRIEAITALPTVQTRASITGKRVTTECKPSELEGEARSARISSTW
ncbi:MAG: FAD-dependent oxidoreductase, partial [Polyangiaceae bacterium]